MMNHALSCLQDCVAHASDANSMQRQRQVNDRRLVLLQVDCNAQTMQQGVASEPLARHAYALYPLAEAMLLVVTLSTMEVWQVTDDAETTTTTSATTTTTNWLFTKTFRCMGTIAIPTKASPAMSPGTTCGALARGSFFDLPPTETRPERAQHVLVTAAIFWQAASTADHLQILIGDEDGHIFLLTMDRSASSLERPQAALKLKLLERMPAPVSAFCFLTATDVFLVLERGDHVVIHLQWPFADDQVDIAATSSMSASQSSGTTLEPVQDFAIKAQGMEPMSGVRSISIRDSMACHHPVTTSLLVQPIRTGLADEERAHPQWHLLCGSAGSGPADSNLWTVVPARDTVALAQCPVGGRAQRLFTLPMNPGETNANESSVADSNQSWSTRNDDALLLISFTQETRVFRFHALALREERELGFERETGTIHASVLFGGEPATPYWLQVHTNGVRLVAPSSSKEGTPSDIEVYATNAQQHIVAADSTVSQLLLLLADGQLVYLVSADAAWPDATGPASTDGTTPTPMNVVFGPPGATTKKATGQRTRTTSATDLSVAPSPTLHAMACCLSPPQDSWSPLMAYVEAGNPVTLRICRLPKKRESASAQCILQCRVATAGSITGDGASRVAFWL
ncbi:Splicing factor 3B subunit 3 [Cyanidiococcus yangmingshanensis]|uniref:Splicing factor 3B subunit 3 n=1 Tax=Cyanidiococcus yangmingshanensis TaxID=2690220 RepID=A0A7J7IKE0_9RHOD|nr:Splicing factor 3B subunit 3 [Cyanidiococcus yangmingshanensis]